MSNYWSVIGSALVAGALAVRHFTKGAIVSQPKAKATAAAPADSKAPAAAEGKDLDYIRKLITSHPDFPSKGVCFRDIFPVFRGLRRPPPFPPFATSQSRCDLPDPVAVEMLFTRLLSHVQTTYGRVDVICGLDSRGFLFGPTLASRLGAAFVPIRKRGKLPGKCLTVSYQKEYGKVSCSLGWGWLSCGWLADGLRVCVVRRMSSTFRSTASKRAKLSSSSMICSPLYVRAHAMH
jgi:adenine/guanine phosphoribosyltransferase-like PRPP-binding protein